TRACQLRVARNWPVSASHTRAALSAPLVTMRLPSGENVALRTSTFGPLKVASRRPLTASHTRAVPSSLAVTTLFPSGENPASLTGPPCPLRVACRRPLTASHTRADNELAIWRKCPHVHRTALMQNQVFQGSPENGSQGMLRLVRRRTLRGLHGCPQCYAKIAASRHVLLGSGGEFA